VSECWRQTGAFSRKGSHGPTPTPTDAHPHSPLHPQKLIKYGDLRCVPRVTLLSWNPEKSMVYEGLSFTSGDGGDEMGEVKWGRGWGRGDGGDEIGDVKHYCTTTSQNIY